MNTRIRYAAYSLAGISVVLTVLLGYPEVNRSRAKAPAAMSTADFRAGTTETVEEKVTLHPANLNTRGRLRYWSENHSYCGPPAYLPKKLVYPKDIPGTIVAGFKNYYDKGAPVFGCPEGSNAAFRGAVWFDLSDIMKKAPPLHVAVQSATLNFSYSGGCPHELLYGTADWVKGYPENTLVPGDHVSSLGSCLPGTDGCHIDVSVETVVNNWLKGAEHGGYANYGFVFKSMQDADLHYENSDGCYSRYGDFSLTADYTYDTPTTYPLECRGIDTFTVLDLDGPPGSKWVGFTFKPGTKPASLGLLPGQCSWKDRGMRAGEPARLAQPIEGAGGWSKELNSSDSFWTFSVYNAGAQLQATGAERTKTFIVPLPRTNVALASNGATASAQDYTREEVYPGSHFQASYAIDGRRYLHLAPPPNDVDGYWRDEHGLPSYLQIEFNGSKTIDEVDIYTVPDDPDYLEQVDPTSELPCKKFGATAFEVQYWDGSAWMPIPGASAGGRGKFAPTPLNDKAWRQFKGFKVTTNKIRVLVNASNDKVARIAEVEAWTP